MKVPKRKYDDWKLLREHGDIDAICEKTGIGRFLVRNALNGSASIETMKEIDKFYKERKKQLA